MDLFIDIGLFVLFLLEYTGYVVVLARLARYIQADPARMLSLRVGQIVIAISIVHFGLTLLLLARVFSLPLLGLLFAAYEFGALSGLVLRAVLGAGVTSSWLFGFELGASHSQAVNRGLAVLGTLMIVGYPTAIGIAYFSLEKGSEELLFWVIALTAILVLLTVVPTTVYSVASLLNPYLDEDLRTQVLVGQLMNMIHPTLWLAIAYWASTSEEGGIGVGHEREFGFAVVVLVLVILVSTFVPYVVGAHRARRQRAGLLEVERRYWQRLAETTEIPMRAAYEEDLRALKEDLGRERRSFAGRHEGFLGALEMLRDPEAREALALTGVGVPTNFDAEVEELVSSDPRTRFDGTLVRLESAATELLEETDGDGATGGSKLAEAWTKAARERRDEAAKASEAAKKSRTRGSAAVGLLFAPILGVVLDQFGALIWEELSTLTT